VSRVQGGCLSNTSPMQHRVAIYHLSKWVSSWCKESRPPTWRVTASDRHADYAGACRCLKVHEREMVGENRPRLGGSQRDTPSVGWLRALSSLACCFSANLSAASLLEKVATTRPLASPSLTSNMGPSWVTRYVLTALNMTWMQRRHQLSCSRSS